MFLGLAEKLDKRKKKQHNFNLKHILQFSAEIDFIHGQYNFFTFKT